MIPVSVENVSLSAVGASAAILILLFVALEIISLIQVAILSRDCARIKAQMLELEKKNDIY